MGNQVPISGCIYVWPPSQQDEQAARLEHLNQWFSLYQVIKREKKEKLKQWSAMEDQKGQIPNQQKISVTSSVS